MKVLDVINDSEFEQDQMAAQFINKFKNNLPNTFLNVTNLTGRHELRLKSSDLQTLLHRSDVNIAIKDWLSRALKVANGHKILKLTYLKDILNTVERLALYDVIWSTDADKIFDPYKKLLVVELLNGIKSSVNYRIVETLLAVKTMIKLGLTWPELNIIKQSCEHITQHKLNENNFMSNNLTNVKQLPDGGRVETHTFKDGTLILYRDKNGAYHRDNNLPASISDTDIHEKQWWRHGKRHRTDGPAYTSDITPEYWHVNGIEITDTIKEFMRRWGITYPFKKNENLVKHLDMNKKQIIRSLLYLIRDYEMQPEIALPFIHMLKVTGVTWPELDSIYQSGNAILNKSQDLPAINEAIVDSKQLENGGEIVTYDNGTIVYRDRNGRPHRDNDLPAVYDNIHQTKEWYTHGKLNRIGKPAIISKHGNESWYVNGSKHRSDGPAINWKILKRWFIDGIDLSDRVKHMLGLIGCDWPVDPNEHSVTICDMKKSIILRNILGYIRNENEPAVALPFIHILKTIGVTWPELDTIQRSGEHSLQQIQLNESIFSAISDKFTNNKKRKEIIKYFVSDLNKYGSSSNGLIHPVSKGLIQHVLLSLRSCNTNNAQITQLLTPYKKTILWYITALYKIVSDNGVTSDKLSTWNKDNTPDSIKYDKYYNMLYFVTNACLLEETTHWPEITKILNDAKYIIIKQLLEAVRWKIKFTANGELWGYIKKFRPNWPEVKIINNSLNASEHTINQTYADDDAEEEDGEEEEENDEEEEELDENRNQFNPDKYNSTIDLFDKRIKKGNIEDAIHGLLDKIKYSTLPISGARYLLDEYKTFIMKYILKKMINNSMYEIFEAKVIIDMLDSVQCKWPELSIINKSIDVVIDDDRKLQLKNANDYSMLHESINTMFENPDETNVVLYSLRSKLAQGRITQDDVDSYLAVPKHKRLIIQFLLETMKNHNADQTGWFSEWQVRDIIKKLRLLNQHWSELNVIENSLDAISTTDNTMKFF